MIYNQGQIDQQAVNTNRVNISQKKYTENLAESYQTVQHRYIITYIFLNMIK